MTQPMVLVTCDRISHRRLAWSAAPASYLEAAASVGLTPVQLPTVSVPLDPEPLLRAVSGVIVTGARSNVHPPLYGRPAEPDAEPYDHDRDRTTLPLIRTAVERGTPVLAICRGVQELNVAFGGTLHHSVHTVEGRHEHHSTVVDDLDEWFGMRHEVTVKPGGLLAPILGTGTIAVNSLHYQAIDGPAERAFVEAKAQDGTVEAISIKDAPAFALGVQWHPEHWATREDNARAVFTAFADAVRDHASGGRRAA
ncbi:MAG: gamma-glutamyl-gamma-aminobutyrate hydrolase family protein [Pseudomonadota bacterium]